MSDVATRSATQFSDLLASAAKLPGVRINREDYLRSALKNVCTEDQVVKAISETPAAAGISREILDRLPWLRGLELPEGCSNQSLKPLRSQEHRGSKVAHLLSRPVEWHEHEDTVA